MLRVKGSAMKTSSFGFKQVQARGLVLCPNLKFDPEVTVCYFLVCYRDIKRLSHI